MPAHRQRTRADAARQPSLRGGNGLLRLRKGSGDAVAGAASVRRLTIEHIEDECAAQDITDILLALGHGGPVDNPEALGFMLRALFEALRRHIAFELEHVFPIKAGALRARPARQSNEGSSQ